MAIVLADYAFVRYLSRNGLERTWSFMIRQLVILVGDFALDLHDDAASAVNPLAKADKLCSYIADYFGFWLLG